MSWSKMSRSICVAFWLLALCGAAGARDILVKQFAGGSGDNNAGIVDASVDTEIDGPQALTTDEKGNLYLLDQVNNRIIKFDPKNPTADSTLLLLPNELRPTDLIVRKSDIMVWDGSVRSLQTANASNGTSTRGLEEINTRAADDDTVLSAFAQMGSQVPGSAADLLDPNTRAADISEPRPRVRQLVASRGAGSVNVDVIPEEGISGARIEIHQENAGDASPLAQLHIKVHDRLGAVEFLEIDQTGRMYVFAENIPTSSGNAAAFVARYSTAGAFEGIYELPLSNVPLSRRFVTVSGDGDVYFMRTQNKTVQVLGVGFRAMPNVKVIDVQTSNVPVADNKSGAGVATAMRPLTRQRVIETAFAFEGIQWKVSADSYGRDPDTACTGFAGRVRRPGYLNGKLGQEVRGAPYCWGCHGSLDQVRSKIEHGVLAGNICTHNAPRTDAAGVDCSAFVSAAWGLATHFTTAAIPAIASRIADPSDLRPGDALNKPGSHVMLFLRFTADRKAEVMESSPGACNGRVCRNTYPLASLLARGFEPVRFRALAGDTSVVTQVATPEQPDKPQKAEKQALHAKRARRH
jgi:hypothetical protein